MLLSGDTIPQDTAKAKKYLESHLDTKNSNILLLYGKALKKDEQFEDAKQFFLKSSKSGNGEAMYEYGKLLYKGQGCQKDEKEALKFFEMSKKNKCNKSDNFLTKRTEKVSQEMYKKLSSMLKGETNQKEEISNDDQGIQSRGIDFQPDDNINKGFDDGRRGHPDFHRGGFHGPMFGHRGHHFHHHHHPDFHHTEENKPCFHGGIAKTENGDSADENEFWHHRHRGRGGRGGPFMERGFQNKIGESKDGDDDNVDNEMQHRFRGRGPRGHGRCQQRGFH